MTLPMYIAGGRCGPHPLQTTCTEDSQRLQNHVAGLAFCKNMIWMLARRVDPVSQVIPSWTGFNTNTRNDISVCHDVVGYLPTINAPATEMATVGPLYETLNQSNLMMAQLHLEQIVGVMDQALYAKATEIAWKHTSKYANIILRVGTFHTITTLLAIIGKRFQDVGLRETCIESGRVQYLTCWKEECTTGQ